MILLFTRSKSPGSRLIRAVTGEAVSHVAISVRGRIAHSAFPRGVEVIPMESFLRGKEVVYTLEYDIPDEVVFERVNKLVGHPYDVSAFAWLALRFLVRKVFHLPFWKIPLWNVSGMYLCTEFVSKTIQKDFPLLTAEQLYRELSTG